jgi:hypothetical protein
LVAKFKYDVENDSYTVPKEKTLKPRRWHKKSGRTEQSGYQFKNTEPSLPGMSSKTSLYQ